MPRKKHLVLIHGRATKPSGTEKERLTRKALLHGLTRVDPSAAKALESERVKLTFVYYGDVNNREMIARDPELRQSMTGRNDAKYGGGPCERAGSYDRDLDAMLAQQDFSKKAYRDMQARAKDNRLLDEFASAASWVSNLIGVSEQLIRGATPDMGAYLTTRKVGSQIRQRLQGPLKDALVAGDDVCLVSHSMGCIVSYDVLWKFSQMSEYQDVQAADNPVSLWLTIGNPLGEPGVQDNLYDADEREDGKYPREIVKSWINIAAYDDFVAHDEKIADDFRDMGKLPGGPRIRDLKKIYTFWVGTSGSNPHKFYGYLDHPKLASEIVKWMG